MFRNLRIAIVSILFLAAATATVPASAGGRAPLESPVVSQIVPVGDATPTAESVRAGIVASGARHGWRVVREVPGKLTLELTVRGKHHVTVDVSYDARQATVEYVSSENMDYKTKGNGVRMIHSSYNRWVHLLVDGIDAASAQP
jgi:hypothetical protein